jgi:hypothetical protein
MAEIDRAAKADEGLREYKRMKLEVKREAAGQEFELKKLQLELQLAQAKGPQPLYHSAPPLLPLPPNLQASFRTASDSPSVSASASPAPTTLGLPPS